MTISPVSSVGDERISNDDGRETKVSLLSAQNPNDEIAEFEKKLRVSEIGLESTHRAPSPYSIFWNPKFTLKISKREAKTICTFPDGAGVVAKRSLRSVPFSRATSLCTHKDRDYDVSRDFLTSSATGPGLPEEKEEASLGNTRSECRNSIFLASREDRKKFHVLWIP